MANAGYSSPQAARPTLPRDQVRHDDRRGCLLGSGFGLVQLGDDAEGLDTSIIVGAGIGFYLPGTGARFDEAIAAGGKSSCSCRIPWTSWSSAWRPASVSTRGKGVAFAGDELVDSAPELTSEFNMANKRQLAEMGRPRREVLRRPGCAHRCGRHAGPGCHPDSGRQVRLVDRAGPPRPVRQHAEVKRRQIAEELEPRRRR